MKAFSILLALLVAGCFPTEFELELTDSPYETVFLEEAVTDFNNEWYRSFDQNVMEYTWDTKIEFYTIKGEDWYNYEEKIIRGQTVSYYWIKIGVPDKKFMNYIESIQNFENGFPIDQTSLFHELTHMILWCTTPDANPDADHAKGDGAWTVEHDKMIQRLKDNWKNKYPYLTGE